LATLSNATAVPITPLPRPTHLSRRSLSVARASLLMIRHHDHRALLASNIQIRDRNTPRNSFTIPSALSWHDDNGGTRTQLRRYTEDVLATLERALADGHRRRSSPPLRHKEVRCPNVRLAMLTFFPRHFQGTHRVVRLRIKTHLLCWGCVGCVRGALAMLISLSQLHTLESTLAGQTIVGGLGGPLPGVRLNHTLLTRHSLAITFWSRLWRDGIHLPPSATLLWRLSRLIGGHAELTSFFSFFFFLFGRRLPFIKDLFGSPNQAIRTG
jgi:hypothetical protein